MPRFPRTSVAAALLALATPVAAIAAQETASYVDIAPGALAPALNQYALAAGITLTFPPELTAGLRTPGASGRFTPDQAFATLLAGTGLRAVSTGPARFRLEAVPRVAQLSTVQVTAELERDPDAFVGSDTTTATKTDTPLILVPQTVNVVTQAQIEAQGSQSVTEALRYTPGMIASFGDSDSRNDVQQSRGFYVRYNLNGSRLPYGAYSSAMQRIEPYGLERVDVLKGPASVLYGQNTPGGLVDLTTKQPDGKRLREIWLLGGSHARKQAAFDLGQRIDAEGRWAFRLTGLARDADGRVDYGNDERLYIAPALAWTPDARTRLVLHAQYQRDRTLSDYAALPDAGTLDPAPFGRLPTSRYLGEPDFDGYERRQYATGYSFTHALNDVWTLRQQTQFNHVDVDTTTSPGYLLEDDRWLSRVASRGWGSADTLTVDTSAQAKFAAAGVQHTLLIGFDALRLKDSYRFSSGPYATPIDILDPAYGQALPELIPRIDYRQVREQYGIYLQEQARWQRWALTLGARHDRASARSTNALPGPSAARTTDTAWTGRAGLTYLFDNGWAPYASYSNSFEPVDGTTAEGTPFRPMTGRQYELGAKFQPEGSKAMFTVSAFDLRQHNIVTPDPVNPGFNVQNGSASVRGLELEGKADLARDVELVAAYAYTHSEITRANPPPTGASLLGNALPMTPRHQAALWLKYGLHELVPGLAVSAGLRYQGESWGDAANTLQMPARTLVDAGLEYDAGRASPSLAGVTARLSVANLFDKAYVGYCQSALLCYYGQGRTVMASVKYRW
ncbi:TonB-dependent siderophore receptor [Verticiella sediminum]|uniref:TonB-dependent siderophore receptor n=1 Tax=Verticiella sediminum TaxID=1247510 RepID=A0A556ALV7_9BURK|nr:TonB-dependent siderophore receptor [Verticiella sediminum]TSH93866.1 TonB-dependent siderophore receptor [Verticiella sediminum]